VDIHIAMKDRDNEMDDELIDETSSLTTVLYLVVVVPGTLLPQEATLPFLCYTSS
jgi:hypothetical protein